MPSQGSPTRFRDIIVIGASAGGLPAVIEIVRRLPAEFAAAVFVVIHTSADSPGLLPTLLQRVTALPASMAEDRQEIRRGRIYVAPPDHHLLIKRAHVRVVRGPKENGFRPAVDPLFRTAALAYGSRVIGVVLSGGLNDGTHGLLQITEHGGLALAQDPEDALVPNMPLSAIQNVEVHRVLPAVAIADALVQLVGKPLAGVETIDAGAAELLDVAERSDSLRTDQPPGTLSQYSCPECGGSLWELPANGTLLRFRCHVGHGFTAEILLAEQESGIELALWTALRALEENAALYERQAERATATGRHTSAQQFAEEGREVGRRAELIRRLIQREGDRISSAAPPDGASEPVEP